MLKEFWRDGGGGETVEWPLVVGVLTVLIVGTLLAVNGEAIRVYGVIQAVLLKVVG